MEIQVSRQDGKVSFKFEKRHRTPAAYRPLEAPRLHFYRVATRATVGRLLWENAQLRRHKGLPPTPAVRLILAVNRFLKQGEDRLNQTTPGSPK